MRYQQWINWSVSVEKLHQMKPLSIRFMETMAMAWKGISQYWSMFSLQFWHISNRIQTGYVTIPIKIWCAVDARGRARSSKTKVSHHTLFLPFSFCRSLIEVNYRLVSNVSFTISPMYVAILALKSIKTVHACVLMSIFDCTIKIYRQKSIISLAICSFCS